MPLTKEQKELVRRARNRAARERLKLPLAEFQPKKVVSIAPGDTGGSKAVPEKVRGEAARLLSKTMWSPELALIAAVYRKVGV